MKLKPCAVQNMDVREEPFRTEFKRRRARPSPNEPGQQNAGLVKAMGAGSFKTAAIIWLEYAFHPTTTSGKRVVFDYQTKHIFAQFYWLLSWNEKDALDFLNKERKDRGYTPLTLDSLTSKKNPCCGLKFKKYSGVDTNKTQTMFPGSPDRNQTSKRKAASPLQDERESTQHAITTPMLGPAEHFTPAQPETFNHKFMVEIGSRPRKGKSKVKHQDNMDSSGAGNQSTLSVKVEPVEYLIPPSRTPPAMQTPLSSEDFIKPEPSSEEMFPPFEYNIEQEYASSENIGMLLSISSNPPRETTERPSKPPLPQLPPIWAKSRQEVCEAYDWFRSYQGGVYHAHGVAKGYLLSAFSSRRDRFEHGGKLIISHGGGKSESVHYSNGQSLTQPASDQLAQDQSVRALLNSYRNHRPVALVMDDRYALFPYDLASKGVVYAVLGFYTITYAWGL
ncbi:unnamed protein product [Cyclocybe aegerita]|uniref:Uncharacterized protein n=1 Tax=Cyclocybe aegerita TaxID=1973307 RepID=A0A8S0WY50_CYCAE|nr:unnamed protein product [Cyclocybe aegerita]